jgi:putative transposase
VFIDAEKANFPIVFMCAEFGVTRRGYAAWRRRQAAAPSARDVEEAALVAEIADIYTWSQGRYGAPRVWRELRRRGRRVGRHRVAGLMAANGLVGRSGQRRGTPRTTVADPAAAPAANVVARDFGPAGPNELWVTDVTYLRTDAGFLFLAAIIDCYSRMVVGWATAPHLRTELCLVALDDAVARRRPRPGLVHHSDRGCQPRFKGSSQRCCVRRSVGARRGLRRVSSRRGSCGAGC